MSSTKDRIDKGVQMSSSKMDDLQAQLDIEVFEQEEMDVDKVKAILAEMEDYTPDTEKKTFDKEQLWKRIEEQSREEFAAEQMLAFDKSKADTKRKGVSGGADSIGRGAKIRKVASMAAVVVLAVFIGANMGTYATAKKSVFEYVGDLKNGTAFWITGDAPSMEFEKEKQVYYSWNDVPDEYKKFLIILQGMPDDIELYNIEIQSKDSFEWATIRYIDDNAINDVTLQIALYSDDEFSFANLRYNEKYEMVDQEEIKEIEVFYYEDEQSDISAQCFYNEYVYTFSGNIEKNLMVEIIRETIEYNF